MLFRLLPLAVLCLSIAVVCDPTPSVAGDQAPASDLAAQVTRIENILVSVANSRRSYLRSLDDASVEAWMTRAEAGDADAVFLVATCYELGHGLSADAKAAYSNYRKGEELGSLACMTLVGRCLVEGIGVEKDVAAGYAKIEQAALKNHVPAMMMLGRYKMLGVGGVADDEGAAKWFREAAKHGNPDGNYWLGYRHLVGIGVEQDQQKFLELTRKAADEGSYAAMGQVGMLHLAGQGVDRDEQKGLELLRRASAADEVSAQFLLGQVLFQKGMEGNRNHEVLVEAARWTRKAADHQLEPAILQAAKCYHLGLGVVRNLEEAALILQEGVKIDSLDAKEQLADLLEELPFDTDATLAINTSYTPQGQAVFEKLASDRLEKWRAGAEAGKPTALFLMALAHHTGTNVPQNSARSREYLDRALKAGSPYAAVELGKSYQASGNRDCIRAYNLAAGLPWAEYQLGTVYDEGKVIPVDQEKAFAYFLRAASGGHLAAMSNVGFRYEIGKGVDRNLEEALKWYAKGAAIGDGTAHLNLGALYLLGNGTEQNPSKAREHIRMAVQLQAPLAGRYQAALDAIDYRIRVEQVADPLGSGIGFGDLGPGPGGIYHMPVDSQYREMEYQRRENAEMNRFYP